MPPHRCSDYQQCQSRQYRLLGPQNPTILQRLAYSGGGPIGQQCSLNALNY